MEQKFICLKEIFKALGHSCHGTLKKQCFVAKVSPLSKITVNIFTMYNTQYWAPCRKQYTPRSWGNSSNSLILWSIKKNSYLNCFVSLKFFWSLLKFWLNLLSFFSSFLLFFFIGHSKYAQEQTCYVKSKPKAYHNKKYHVDLPRSIKDLRRVGKQDKRGKCYLSSYNLLF